MILASINNLLKEFIEILFYLPSRLFFILFYAWWVLKSFLPIYYIQSNIPFSCMSGAFIHRLIKIWKRLNDLAYILPYLLELCFEILF